MLDGRRCCIIGCQSKGSKDCTIKFYSFPKTSWLKEKRQTWIDLVNRKNADGSPWQPTARSFICSAHFVGNEKSEHPLSPSFLPTIFPDAYYKVKPLTKTKINRIARNQQRDVRRRLIERGNVIGKKECAVAVRKKLRSNSDAADTNTPDLITIRWDNHHEKLVNGLWNRYLLNSEVDYDVKWGNQSIRVHRFILDLFLTPKKLSTYSKGVSSDDNDSIVEFLYKGSVTVPKARLTNLMQAAKESEFQMLVDALSAATVEGKARDIVHGSKRAGIGQLVKTTSRAVQTDKTGIVSSSMQTDRVVFSRADLELFKTINNLQAENIPTCPDEEQPITKTIRHRPKSKKNAPSDLKSMMRVKQSETSSVQSFGTSQLAENTVQSTDRSSNSNCDLCQEKIADRSHPDEIMSHQCDVYLVRHDAPNSSNMPESSAGGKRAPWYVCLVCGRALPLENLCSGHLAQHQAWQFRCSACGRAFRKELEMLEHTSKHTDKKSFRCSKCNITFAGLHPLYVHMRTHSDEQPVKCDTCKRIFSTAAHLKNHQRFHSAEIIESCSSTMEPVPGGAEIGEPMQSIAYDDVQSGNMIDDKLRIKGAAHVASKHDLSASDEVQCYECLVCLKTFLTEEQCALHVEKHVRRPFWCKVCDASFTKEEMLETHALKHKENAFLCSECGKSFTSKGNLTVHARVTHAGVKAEKRKVCEVCGARFTNNHRLNNHQRVHTGERPFKCDFQSCGRAFATRTSMVHHRKTHTNEKPHFCHVCEKRFRQRSHLVIHSRTHTGERPYKCHLCDLACTTSGNLRAHLLTHAKGHSPVNRISRRAPPRFNFGSAPASSSCYGVGGWESQMK